MHSGNKPVGHDDGPGRAPPGRNGNLVPSIPTHTSGFALLAAVLLVGAAGPAAAGEAPAAQTGPAPLAAQSRIARAIIRIVDRDHYPPAKSYANLPRRILDQYIDMLDPGHFYFTLAEIKDLQRKFDGKLLADVRRGNVAPAFAIYGRYRNHVRGRIGRALEMLRGKPGPVPKGTYAPDGSAAPPPSNATALDQRWRKRVANDLMALRVGGASRKTAESLLQARYRRRLARVQAAGSETIFDRFMDACLRALDPHSDYFSPTRARQFENRTDLRGGGVGVHLAERDGYATVTGTVPGSPASRTRGLRPGDRIAGVGQGRGGHPGNVTAWRLEDIVDVLHGPPGSRLSLLVLRAGEPAGGRETRIDLTRAAIAMDSGRAHAYILPGQVQSLRYRIGVIRIPSIYGNLTSDAGSRSKSPEVSSDVRYLLKVLKTDRVSAVLLDLRNDRGGSPRQALALTGLFVPPGPVIQIENAAGRIRTLSTPEGSGPVWRGPLGVLTNRGTASAAEILTSALKNYGRAIVLGTTTWGKGTIQTFIPLHYHHSEAGAIKLTVAQYYGLDGSSPQRHGIRPDIDIPEASGDAGPQGEAEYPNALPWKKISPIKHPVLDRNLPASLKKLRSLFRDKLRETTGFKLYEHELALDGKWADRSRAVTLGYRRRKTALDRRRSAELAVDNAWRNFEGKPAFTTLDKAARARFRAPDIVLRTSVELLADYASFSPSSDIELDSLYLPQGKYHCKENPLDLDGSYTRCVNYGRRIIRPPSPGSTEKSLKGPAGRDRMPRVKTLQ